LCAVDHGFEPRSGQTKTKKVVGASLLSTQYNGAEYRDGWVWNQDNASELSDMYTYGLLFQWASTIQIQLNALLIKYKVDIIIIISSNVICSRHNILAHLFIHYTHTYVISD